MNLLDALRRLFAGRGSSTAFEFHRSHRSLHRTLQIPRAPRWATSIEEGVVPFRERHFTAAVSHFKAAEAHSPSPIHQFISINNVAAAYCAERRYAEAEPLYRRLVDTWYQVLSPEDRPEIIVGLNNLATALAGQGRYAEAEAALRRALGTESRTPDIGPGEIVRFPAQPGLTTV